MKITGKIEFNSNDSIKLNEFTEKYNFERDDSVRSDYGYTHVLIDIKDKKEEDLFRRLIKEETSFSLSIKEKPEIFEDIDIDKIMKENNLFSNELIKEKQLFYNGTVLFIKRLEMIKVFNAIKERIKEPFNEIVIVDPSEHSFVVSPETCFNECWLLGSDLSNIYHYQIWQQMGFNTAKPTIKNLRRNLPRDTGDIWGKLALKELENSNVSILIKTRDPKDVFVNINNLTDKNWDEVASLIDNEIEKIGEDLNGTKALLKNLLRI